MAGIVVVVTAAAVPLDEFPLEAVVDGTKVVVVDGATAVGKTDVNDVPMVKVNGVRLGTDVSDITFAEPPN